MAKAKKCKWCKAVFEPFNTMQIVCNTKCALLYSESLRQRKYKAETRAMKQARDDVDRSLWLKKAQKACNEYIRERDKNDPCISCGRSHDGQYHAGHYRSVGACSALRFDERNIWKQCAPCNSHLSGNLVEYRKSLLVRLGLDVVEWLEQNHDIKKWTIEELKEIESEYKRKLKELNQ